MRGRIALLAAALASSAAAQSIDFGARGMIAQGRPYASAAAALKLRLQRAANAAAISNPEINTLASGVTMTVATTATGGLSKSYSVSAGAGFYAGTGGLATYNATYQVNSFPVSSLAPATGANLGTWLGTSTSLDALGWEISFQTDADKVQIRAWGKTSTGFQILVDGKYVARTMTAWPAYQIDYVTLDFASVRQARTVTLIGNADTAFQGVDVGPTANVWKPAAAPQRITALVTGDSYSEGVGTTGSYYAQGWAKILGRLMGWGDVRQVAVGSTGYLADASGTRKTIRAQVADWFVTNSDLDPKKIDVVVVAGGLNDRGFTNAQIQAEALLAWAAIRAKCPNALIVVLGPWPANTGPSTQLIGIDQALQASFAQWGDPLAIYVPVSGDPAPWLFGTGKIGATNATGNSDLYVGSDGLHPSDAGHMQIARRAQAALLTAFAAF